ncbi:DUF2569 domain-containing protein [Geobacter sp. AOG2]|uniref:DUF2569 domain-containing protein n=1 Tax=Geobacter sp. AOG2 TaxID=1566347 RepID=UPI001CC376EA|nr:DUF2569 family protein [Geobacter sp. AOG2]GFE62628.1 hypothetical protein AOG2_32160 [Geobacter sp. AOG2]
MFCTRCGTQAISTAKYCAKCGASLNISSSSREPEQPHQTETITKTSPEIIVTKAGPSGIGGWLTLLIVGMMLLRPLMGLGKINADFMTAERQYPNLESLGLWKTFNNATWFTFTIVTAISIYGGFGLAKGRNWKVVKQAKIILWIIGPLASIVLSVIIPKIVLGNTKTFGADSLSDILTSFLAASIWTIYLSKSKRVRNTYSNLKPLETRQSAKTSNSEENKNDTGCGNTEDQPLKEKYCAAIGKNSEYYVDRFIHFKIVKCYFSWNWAAFLFCIPWTVYRRMYKLAAVFIVIFSFWCYQSIKMLEYSKVNQNLEEVWIALLVLAWCAKGTYGIFANALYFYHVDKNKL